MTSPPRRKSLRLPGYDYSQTGAYFVTICVKSRECLFGAVISEEMIVNELGRIVQSYWQNLANHFSHIDLDYFMVMPNHLHGIIFLVGAGSPRPQLPLGNLIGYFKFQVTKKINEFLKTPSTQIWQRGFYEHVIRNEESLNRIREYIMTNPSRWYLDRENPLAQGRDDFDGWLAGFKGRPLPKKRVTRR
jgi:REP element-mobilizing transposase RayT